MAKGEVTVQLYVHERVDWSGSRQWVHKSQKLYGVELEAEIHSKWSRWAIHRTHDKIARGAIQQVKYSLTDDPRHFWSIFIGVPPADLIGFFRQHILSHFLPGGLW